MKKKHVIEDLEFTPGSYNLGSTLSYLADGELINVQGEFRCDRNGVYAHTHVFPDGYELEIHWQ